MVTGFGLIDYVVVSLTAVMTLYMLLTRPERLLWFLPTFLTLDFFIPLGTQLTPGRLVPLLIAAWMVSRGELGIPKMARLWILALLVCTAIATVAGFLVGDAGIRPVFRGISFVNMAVLFIFSGRMMLRIRSVEPAVWGVAYAGLLHGLYSVYQLIAFNQDLPFRGVVYSAEGASASTAGAAGGLRINGLADEPKRLGYVLFAAALAYLVFAMDRRYRQVHGRRYMLIASGLIGLSALTYSGSYFAAVAIWAVMFLGMSRYVFGGLLFGLVGLAIAWMAVPDALTSYAQQAASMLDQRTHELAVGLNSGIVYRQEFYAEDYVRNNPYVVAFGLGMGRYNAVLRDVYGAGAGIGVDGQYMPLNSQVYEVMFNLGAVGILILYVGVGALALRVGWREFEGWGISAILGFLLLQSVFIDDLLFLSFFAAAVTAYVMMREETQAMTGRGALQMAGGTDARRSARGPRDMAASPAPRHDPP